MCFLAWYCVLVLHICAFCAPLITIVENGPFQALSAVAWELFEAVCISHEAQEEHLKLQKDGVVQETDRAISRQHVWRTSILASWLYIITKQQKNITAFGSSSLFTYIIISSVYIISKYIGKIFQNVYVVESTPEFLWGLADGVTVGPK